MKKKYTLWVTIEEHDLKTDQYQDVGDPIPVGEFDSLEEAQAHVNMIENL